MMLQKYVHSCTFVCAKTGDGAGQRAPSRPGAASGLQAFHLGRNGEAIVGVIDHSDIHTGWCPQAL